MKSDHHEISPGHALEVTAKPVGGGRFDYVKYDDKALLVQDEFKQRVYHFEQQIEKDIKSPRSKALALTKLEECYMWIGKAIRDDQIARNGSAPLQEERNNG